MVDSQFSMSSIPTTTVPGVVKSVNDPNLWVRVQEIPDGIEHDIHISSFWSRFPFESLSVGDLMEIILWTPKRTIIGVRKSLAST
jgi:hypothetical protein